MNIPAAVASVDSTTDDLIKSVIQLFFLMELHLPPSHLDTMVSA